MIGDKEVHIWHADLRFQGELSGLLSRDEMERAKRLKVHRERFIAARGLLRKILSRYTGESPDRMVFSYSPNGKPYLSGSRIRFSLSHSGDFVAVAVALDEVGIDIEQMRDVGAVEGFLPATERQAIAASPSRNEAVLRAWTRKEAALKASGGRLSDIGKELPGWSVSELEMEGLVGAIAFGKYGARIVMNKW